MSKKKIFSLVGLVIVVGIIALIAVIGVCRTQEKDRASLYQLRSDSGKTQGINIDGSISQGEWNNFRWSDRAEEALTVYIASDNQYLYLAVEAKGDTSDDWLQDYAVLCIIPGEEKEIKAGEFKTVKIRGDEVVVWEDWSRSEELPITRVRKASEYKGELASKIEINEAVMVPMVQSTEYVHAFFAENITDLPEGLAGKTSFVSYRVYELKVPLSILGVSSGQTIRVFGYVVDSKSGIVQYPNSRTKSLATSIFKVAKVPLP